MNILILYTGGTIGCVGSPLSPMNGADFQQAFTQWVTPIVQGTYPDCTFGFAWFTPTLDSTNMQPVDWCSIAAQVLQNYADYDAFIVLHGTDSMAWTASALSFLLSGLQRDGTPLAALTKPVVVTGAQLPLFTQQDRGYQVLFNTDALQNVCGAVASAYAGIAEVGLYFCNALMRGNRAVKTNASQFQAFTSPNYPLLAQSGIVFSADMQNVLAPAPASLALDKQWPAVLEQVQALRSGISSVGVMAFPAFPAWFTTTASPTALIANLLAASFDQGIGGLILQSYGEGNFPSGNPADPQSGAIYQVLRRAHAAGAIIVDCTQVTAGTVNATAYAAGSWLAECGVIGASDMTSVAALAKLAILLGLNSSGSFGWSQAQIQCLMQTSLVGEIQSIDRLGSFGTGFLAPGQSISTLDGSATLLNDPVRGPVLSAASANPPVDFPLIDAGQGAMPGRLYVTDDGTVSFRDRTNTTVYLNAPVVPATDCSLALRGSAGTTPALIVTSAATNEVVTTLYPPPTR
jgi:L-asparaginase